MTEPDRMNIIAIYWMWLIPPGEIRPLSSMTLIEAISMNISEKWDNSKYIYNTWEGISFTPEQTLNLIKRGFDIFNILK